MSASSDNSDKGYGSGVSDAQGSLYAGVMSGTSADGVDAVLVDFGVGDWRVLGHVHLSFSENGTELRKEILALNLPGGQDELHRAALLSHALAERYADAVQRVLAAAGVSAQAVRAVGVHGQTVRHRPQPNGADGDSGTAYTLQLNNPALVAEKTGIDVVADFRSRDVAAGGQGAPLAPLFHQAWLRYGVAAGQSGLVPAQHAAATATSATSAAGRQAGGTCSAVLNLGGMANVTLLDAQLNVLHGFDTGPANVLMDAWIQQHLHRAYDASGAWAAGGTVHGQLLRSMLAEPFFAVPPPKSTGRDLFSTAWLMRHLQAAGCRSDAQAAQDVQATLLELTARSVSDALAACSLPSPLGRLLLCGGGAYNAALRQRLAVLMPGVAVRITDDEGLPAQQVEAVAFAWLAKQLVDRQALPLSPVTGARGRRMLGALYPA